LPDIINCVSISAIDPNANDRNWQNSLGDFLPAPSAIFEGLKRLPLIWLVNPKSSDGGKLPVVL
jgi:hypothetical protein